MAYNPEKDATAGYISKRHKIILDRLRKVHKRTLRAELEYLIEEAAN